MFKYELTYSMILSKSSYLILLRYIATLSCSCFWSGPVISSFPPICMAQFQQQLQSIITASLMKKHLADLRNQNRRETLESRFNYNRSSIMNKIIFQYKCQEMDQAIEEEYQEYVLREKQRTEQEEREMREREEEILEMYQEYLREAEERERQITENGGYLYNEENNFDEPSSSSSVSNTEQANAEALRGHYRMQAE